jgi:hypothetical protein
MEEKQAQRGGRSSTQVRGRANVTPKKKKSGLDDLKEL